MSRFANRGERNEAFFNQHQAGGRGGSGGGVAQGTQSLNALLRSCHSSGSLSLTNRDLSEIPLLLFSASLDEGEKFWEMVPLQKLDLSFNSICELPATMPARYVLHVAYCMLHVACCMLHVACCMLHVACCMLHVAANETSNKTKVSCVMCNM